MEKIFVSGPWITEKEIGYVTDAVTNAWYGNANLYNSRFEQAFAAYLGCPYAVALPSCTSAIHLSLLALGVGPGDEVIVPELTWIASAAPISYVGATPVFADIDPETWCLSATAFEQAITPRTKAVIIVDLYGNMPRMRELVEVAEKYGVKIIEDAAEAMGSEYSGSKAGTFGKTGVFSFHGSKTLTTGEGGMLVTGNEELYRRVLFLRDHGRKPGDILFFNEEVAHKYKMSSMQAALGLAQLERIEELIDRKRQIFSWYREELAGIPGLCLNPEPPEVKNSFWMVTLLWDTAFDLNKIELMKRLAAYNIDTRPFFFPLSSIPAYQSSPEASTARQRNRHSYTLSAQGINLPSGLNLTPQMVQRVCQALKEVFGMAGNPSQPGTCSTLSKSSGALSPRS